MLIVVARGPGTRRGDHLAGRAVDRDDDVRGGRRAQQGARHLGRARRLGRGGGRPPRRHPHEVPRLGVDLLRQRPRRRARARAHAADRPGEPRGPRASALRRSRRRDASPAGIALLVYAISKAPDVGWANGSHDRADHRVRSSLLAGVRRLGAAHRGSARPVRHLSHPHSDRRERRRLPARRLDLRQLLHPHALRPAGPGLVGAEDGSDVPGHGGHDRDLGRRRAGARDEDRPAARSRRSA